MGSIATQEQQFWDGVAFSGRFFMGDSPVHFPDPAGVAVEHHAMRLLPLPQLIELKLASGLSATHRLKDLADVLELVKVAKLPRELEKQLDASVRAKFLELWDAAQVKDPLSED